MTQRNFRVRNGLTIDGTTSGSSSFASTATGTDLSYVLPGSQGSVNTVLTNDGSGNLSWALPGGGGSTFGNVTVGVDSDQTISTTSGDLILQTAAGVNAGTMTFTAGANGNITLDPNGTGNVAMTLANGGNLTNTRNYVYGAIRNATTQTNGDMWSFSSGSGGAYRGVTLDNSVDTTKRPGVVLRSYGISGGAPRSAFISENARGTAASPSNVTTADRLLEINASGYVVGGGTSAVTGWATDSVANVPGIIRIIPAEDWNDGLNKVGTRFQVILTPPSTTFSTSSSATVLNAATDLFQTVSNQYNFNNVAGNNNLTVDVNGNVAVRGDLTVTGNDINSSTATAITLSGADVNVLGDLTITGNDIKSSSATAITLSGADVNVLGDLTVTGNDINSSSATAITLSGADVTILGDLAVNGGDITTTQTTASVFNTTATTVNVGGAATLAVNLGNANGSIVKGANRYTSPTIAGFAGGATSPSRGLSVSNGNGSSAALARNALVLRTYPTSGGARGQLLFENARGTETTPTALQNNDLVGEVSASGYATNGWVSDYVTAVPGVTYFTPTENWANTGGPYPTAGTVTNAGTGYIVALQPTATTVTASNGSRINVLNINPQSFNQRSDSFNWNKGKTNSTSMAALNDDGNGHTVFSVNQLRATASSYFPVINFTTFRSTDGTNYTPTQLGDYIGAFKFNGNEYTSTTPGVAGGPGAQIFGQATENWTSTAQGTKFSFFANKNTTTSSYEVLGGNPDTFAINSDTTTFANYDGSNTRLTLNSTSATFTKPVGFPVDTAANWNAVTGSVGQQVSVSNSPTVGGRMAFWDTTNARWSYISDNSAV